MTKTQLQEIKARAERATKGPWRYCPGDSFSAYPAVTVKIDGKWLNLFIAEDQDFEAETEFIAHARTDIPNLLAHIEFLQATITEADLHIEDVCARADEEINKLRNALEELLRLCDRGPDLSQSGDEPKQMQEARKVLKQK